MKKLFVLSLFFVGILFISAAAKGPQPLRLDVYVAEKGAAATATIIYGETESILIDAGYFKTEATKVADRVAATGTHLKAIIITHPHEDHFVGLGAIHARFPDTPIYMSSTAAIDHFKRVSQGAVDGVKRGHPDEASDVPLPMPELLPNDHLLVDGQTVEIRQGNGDDWRATNGYAWIPSLRAVVAGDMVYNQVHVWLATSNEQSCAAWIESLDKLSALKPLIVVAGHKKSTDLKDTPDAIEFTKKYIQDFQAARKSAATAAELVAAMKAKYPDCTQAGNHLPPSAQKAFRKS